MRIRKQNAIVSAKYNIKSLKQLNSTGEDESNKHRSLYQ